MATAGYVQISLIWVAYAIAVSIALIAASLVTFIWKSHRERSVLANTVAILSLTALLATIFLLPVDVALVSATTNSTKGVKKDWASPSRVDNILYTLKVAYYCIYSFDTLLCLVVIPSSYFWYEEYNEFEGQTGDRTICDKLWRTFKHTIPLPIIVVSLFFIGGLVPITGERGGGYMNLGFFKHLLDESRGEKALAFGLGLLITPGILFYILYTGAGLAILPISLIKSAPSISSPHLSENISSQLEQNREHQRALTVRNAVCAESMPQKERREMDALVHEEITLVRRGRLASEAQGEGKNWIIRLWVKVQAISRPIKLIGGIVLILIIFLVWVSMLITGIDKAANSVCKQHCGYILAHINIFQPTNWIFVHAASIFPLDYVLIVFLVLLFVSSSISGLATIGIRFLWLRIFQIRKGRTPPQDLLIAILLLALIMLAINYSIAMLVAPQYSAYGTQTFCDLSPHQFDLGPNCTEHPEAIKPCSELVENPRALQTCTPTMMSTLLNRVALNWPFFGALDFWAQLAFSGTFLVVFLTSLFKTPKLDMNEDDEGSESGEREGLLGSTGRRFGATWQDITGNYRQTLVASGLNTDDEY